MATRAKIDLLNGTASKYMQQHHTVFHWSNLLYFGPLQSCPNASVQFNTIASLQLGSFVIFQGLWTSVAKKPYICEGGGRTPAPPSGSANGIHGPLVCCCFQNICRVIFDMLTECCDRLKCLSALNFVSESLEENNIFILQMNVRD